MNPVFSGMEASRHVLVLGTWAVVVLLAEVFPSPTAEHVA